MTLLGLVWVTTLGGLAWLALRGLGIDPTDPGAATRPTVLTAAAVIGGALSLGVILTRTIAEAVVVATTYLLVRLLRLFAERSKS